MKRFSKKHSFKVFRKTTRFKKYRLGMTKFVRKFYARKKRRTSVYMNSHILYSWIHHYLKHRQFIRFTQSFGLAPIHGYVGNADFSIKNSLIVGAEYGFHSYSCSSKVLNKSVFFENSIFQNKIISFESRNSFIQFVDYESSSNSNEIGTNLLYFDKLCYPFDLEKPFNSQQIDFLNEIENSVFEVSLSLLIEFKKVMIIATLLTIKK
jgi:hypothetical protein